MKRSEIFESFVKIAQDKGLVAKAEHAEHTEQNTRNPRWDSLSIEQIEKLYGVKPDSPADMKYDRNIIEDAHPDPVVVSTSYDKLNGLVENENEGQNIRARIVMKEPSGQLTNHKYAKQQLTLSLVRVANDLDNNNEEELRKLADFCLIQTASPKMIKTALWPLLIGVAAAALGAIYLKNHLNFHSSGFEVDFQNTMKEIDDVLTSNTNFGVGYSYRPEFIQVVTALKDKLQKFYNVYQKILPVLDKMDAPKTGKELLELSQTSETKEILSEVSEFRAEALDLYPFIRKIIKDFENESYKARQVADKGFFNTVIDAVPGLHGGSGLVSDDFDDIKHALGTILEDITSIMKSVQNSNSIEQSAKQELQQSAAETQSEPTVTENKPSDVKPNEGEDAPWSDLENQLSGGLGGLQ